MTEETLFHAALSKPVAERAAFLEGACLGKPELLVAILALLKAHEASVNPLDQPLPVEATKQYTPLPNSSTHSYTSPDPIPGFVIAGRYTLEQKLGEGGMGEVWVAKQSEPVKRKVAIKLIKPGMDSRSVVQRFEQERQALAMMDHPHIAKVLDGGITSDRRPFFVMELVNGLPLTKFCDEAKLGIKERLELFVPICHAVQHAHQKGIVHRDLKPSNILVTLVDGNAMPKVIDFGVAKATGGKLTDETMSTQFGAVIGTLEYMAPEQAGYSNVDVDTRADIYSLGIVLYELLTGPRPFDSKRLKNAALDEMIRMIREDEPSKPSTRLSTDESLPSLAANRHIEPGKLTALLRGELDWVVMRCLEKHRDRRYETANGLARDIQRYLSNETVEARPPSAGYRMKKFISRNKGKMVAASVVFLALVVGVIGTLLGLLEAKRQEQRAIVAADQERKAKLEVEHKKQEAERNLAYARKGNEILGSVFANLDPKQIAESGRPLQDVLRENLRNALHELEGTAIGTPLEVAAMQHTLGHSLLALGEHKLAIEVDSKALKTRMAELGADHLLTLKSMINLAVAYWKDGQFEKAIPLFEEIHRRQKSLLGADHGDTISTIGDLAQNYKDIGQYEQALPLFEESFRLHKNKLGPDDLDTIISMHNLALGYDCVGQKQKSLDYLEESTRRAKLKLGLDHPHTRICQASLGVGYLEVGKYMEAISLIKENLDWCKDRLGPDHPQTLDSMLQLAEGYRVLMKLDLALPLAEEVFNRRSSKHGQDHPRTIGSMQILASIHQDAGQSGKALTFYQDAYQLAKRRFGRDHPNTLSYMVSLALAYKNDRQFDQALRLYQEALRLMSSKLGDNHSTTLACMHNLGTLYSTLGKHEEGAILLEKTLARRKVKFDRGHPNTLVTAGCLLDAYRKAGKSKEEETLLNTLLADVRNVVPIDNAWLTSLLARYASLKFDLSHFDESEQLFRECLAIRQNTQPDAWTTYSAMSMLGGTLEAMKKYTEAEPLLLKGYEGMKQREKVIPAIGRVRLTEALDRLIQLYTETNKPEEVKKWQAEKEKLLRSSEPAKK